MEWVVSQDESKGNIDGVVRLRVFECMEEKVISSFQVWDLRDIRELCNNNICNVCSGTPQ